MRINQSKIKTKNWRIGDVVSISDEQYQIYDFVNGEVVLEKLSFHERVKREFILARLQG